MKEVKVYRAAAFIAFVTTGLLGVTGCGDSSKSAREDQGHNHGAGGHTHGGAETGTPHAGTPVQVGEHGYHLELVPDPVEGKMFAYVLDAHLEKGVRVTGGPFKLVAKESGLEHRLTFNPVTNMPNDLLEKSSVFSASASNLNRLTNFEGVIPKITLDGKTFENATFSYPKGSRHEH